MGIEDVYRDASVKVYFYDDENELHIFERCIDSSGNGVYKINSITCNVGFYHERLAEHGILVKARNFLVFQGDVTSVASKTPKQLTHLFEEISGSLNLKDSYENAKIEKEKAEELCVMTFQKKRSINSERKQLKEQKEEAEAYQRAKEQLNILKTKLHLWEL